MWPRQEIDAARAEIRHQEAARLRERAEAQRERAEAQRLRARLEQDYTELLQCASQARSLLASAGHGQAVPGTGDAWIIREADIWLERGGARLLDDESSESD